MYKIIGKPDCSYCVMAKDFLTAKGQEFEYVDLTNNQELINELSSQGLRTVPQIWHNDRYVGNFQQLVMEKF